MPIVRTKAKPRIVGNLRVKVYDVLEMCIENGIAFGWSRAHKHVEDPDEDSIKESIRSEVMNAIFEYFDTGDEP